MRIDILAAVLVLAPAGVLAGAGARWVLARLRRGARVRAPACEIAVGLLWATAGAAWGGGVLGARWLPLLLGLSWLAVAASVVDLRHRRLPDALTLPAAVLAPLTLVPLGTAAVGRGLLTGSVAVLAHAAVHAAAPAALGAGDVKLAASLGAVTGGVSWAAFATAGVAASALSLVLAVATTAVGALRLVRAPPSGGARPPGGAPAPDACGSPHSAVPPPTGSRAASARGGRGRRSVAVPHGPSMLAAAWLVVAAAAVAGGAG
jgi:leader peptidase (prepilin peptidase) / N-methyltransferase